MKVGPPVTDITAGILGAMGILATYAHRLKTGEGQMVDTSLYEAGIVQTYFHSAIYLATGESPGPIGSAHIMSAPYQAFPTAAVQRGAPVLGEHTREILAEIGFATEEAKELEREGVVKSANGSERR